MDSLLEQLKPFNLTKAEVLMLINLGVGTKRPRQRQQPPPLPGETDEEGIDEGAEGDSTARAGHARAEVEGTGPMTATERNPAEEQDQQDEEETDDRQLLGTVVEELDERLTEQQIDELLRILRSCLQPESSS